MNNELVEHQQRLTLVEREQTVSLRVAEQLFAVQTAAAVLRGLEHRRQIIRPLERFGSSHERVERACWQVGVCYGVVHQQQIAHLERQTDLRRVAEFDGSMPLLCTNHPCSRQQEQRGSQQVSATGYKLRIRHSLG